MYSCTFTIDFERVCNFTLPFVPITDTTYVVNYQSRVVTIYVESVTYNMPENKFYLGGTVSF